MKHKILSLLVIFFALSSPISSQVQYDEEQEDESFSLNTPLNSNRSYHYTASSRIDLNPGFSYAPARGKSALFEIDEMMVFPPSAGITGGPNPTVDNGVVGAIGGTVNISALGGAVYSIPIEVLPGKDGMQPSLSVTYNSQTGNGLLGYGWNLTGISSITRCGRTIYHDLTSTNDAVDYTNDRFMLDGQRLLSISSNKTYGQSGCEYRTEVDNISKIKSYGGDGQNPDSFKVWTKDGYIIEYGNSTDSKLLNPYNNHAAMWMINKISDYNGNYMIYHYHTTTNSCRIDYIEYTGCSNVQPMYKVRFNYIEREDKEYCYLYDQKIVLDVLLSSISIEYNNNEVYKYTFTYDGINPENGRFYSRLMSIGLEQNNEKLNPTTIVWGDYISQYDSTLDITNNSIKDACYVGDFNGDGIDDIVTFPYINQNTTDTWMCLYGNGDGTFTYTGVYGNNKISGNYIRNVIPCDLNGDGLCDMLTLSTNEYSSNNNGVYNYQAHIHAYFANSDGNGFTLKYIGNYVTSINIFDCVQVGDYLGNGTTDIMFLSGRSNSGGTSGTYITLGTYDFVNDCFTTILDEKNVSSKCDIVTQGDFNGDGRTDILLTDGYNSSIYTLIKNGYNWDLTTLYSAGYPTQWHKVYVGDFNGDGKTDLLTWANDASPQWQVAIYKTTGFVDQWGIDNSMGFPTLAPPSQSVSLEGSLSNATTYDIKISDIDGDGKTDIIFVYYNNIKVFHSPVSHGTSTCTFIRNKTINNPDGTSNIPGQNYTSYNLVGKFTNNSYYSLLLRYHPNVTRKYFIKSFDNQHKQNCIKSITDGLGNAVSFNYDYFTNPEFYTISSGSRFVNINDRVRKQIIPLKALRSMTTQNISGTNVTTQYSYEDMYYHMTGRGILGFKKTIVNDSTNGIKTVNINRYAGSNRSNSAPSPFLVPDSLNTYLINGNTDIPIKETSSSCILAVGPSILNQQKPVTVQTESLHVINHDINGDPVNIEITEYDYDNTDYGNVSKYGYNNVIKNRNGCASSNSITQATACPFRVDTDITYYNAIEDTWLVSRVNKSRTSHLMRDDGGWHDIIKNSVQYTYYDNYPNMIKTEQINPGDSTYSKLVVNNEYDYTRSDGNISAITQKVSAPNDATAHDRTTSIEYSSQYQYRFPTKTTNSMNYVATSTYDPKFGWKLSDTDCNGLVTTYETDFFGLDNRTTAPDGTVTIAAKRWSRDHSNAPQGALYYTWTQSSGSYPTMTFYHKTGVPLRHVNRDIDGQVIYVDMMYDTKGNLYRKSLPYEADNSPDGYITYNYDRLNRLILTEYPDGTSDEVIYNGNQISYIHHDSGNMSSQTVTKKYHPNGWLEETTDSGGNIVKYEYNSDGTLKSSYVDGSNSAVTLTYNSAGMRTSINDPDYGLMQYNYNAFGELTYQKTPKNAVTEYEYDDLGRMTFRKMTVPREPDETTAWKYSSETGHLGTLEKIIYNSGAQIITYQYDGFQRVVHTDETYDNTTYSTSYTYNQLGRLSTETYPSGFTVRNRYNGGGYLIAVNDLENNTLWQADEHDIYGHLTEFHTGNGLTTYRDYDSENGRLLGIITGNDRNIFQNYTYTYDDFGNFASRNKNVGSMLSENFTYDNFNRLTGINTNGVSYSMAYDRYGRMESKSQDGFTFDCARFSNEHPHAMSHVQTHSQPPFAGHTATYTPFDKVKTITQGTDNLLIEYGYDRQHIRMTETVGGHERVKTYIGNCEFVHSYYEGDYNLTYLYSPDGIFAVAESTNHGFQLHYVHTDNLGSWDIITNSRGNLEQSLSFDAWGNRRDATTWNGLANDTPMFDRGFTGHEHLYNFGLINMNGRVYDPFLSTFLSPDNYIQCPDNSQNFNRYAYCLNNPLKYTDPSGEWIQYVVGAIIGGINGYCIGYSAGLTGSALFLSTISGAAIGAVTCGVGNYFTSTVGPGFGSMCGGAVSGFGYGLLGSVVHNSKTPLNDAALGCLKGIVSGFVGAMVGASIPYGDSWAAGALFGGAASNVTSQLLSHDWNGKDAFSLNWKSTLFSAGLSWGICYGSSYFNYKNNVKNWNPKSLKIKFGQYLKIQGMHTKARFWRSEQMGGAFWLTSKGTTNKNVIYDEYENTVSFKFPKPDGAIATVHDHPYNDSDVAQDDLWNSADDIKNVLKYKMPSIVINKHGAAIAYPTDDGFEQITNTMFWGNSLWGYGNPYYSYPYYAAKYYFNLKP